MSERTGPQSEVPDSPHTGLHLKTCFLLTLSIPPPALQDISASDELRFAEPPAPAGGPAQQLALSSGFYIGPEVRALPIKLYCSHALPIKLYAILGKA